MLIYLAGPIRADSVAEREKHIRDAGQVACMLWSLDHSVICPQYNTKWYWDLDCKDSYITHEKFMQGDLIQISRCDMVLMLPGWQGSEGACEEERFARKKGINLWYLPIVWGSEDLPRNEHTHSPPGVVSMDSAMGSSMFVVNDSGERETFESGMVRDTSKDKIDYTLVLDGPMLKRWAEHLTKGAKKYKARNWLKAAGQEELARFRESALRHMLQWLTGETDEDHAAAVYFNVNGAEYTTGKMGGK